MSNMRNIGLAIQSYAAAHGGFLPPAYLADNKGRPTHSWRVLMLPYFDRQDLYEKYRFDEPWDGPHNRLLHDTILEVYCCSESGRRSTNTSYVVVRGNETAWPDSQQTNLNEISHADGAENTLLVIEMADSGIHWMEPRDLEFSNISFQVNPTQGKGISSKHKGLAVAAFCDGRVKALSKDLPESTVRALLTVRGGEKIRDTDY